MNWTLKQVDRALWSVLAGLLVVFLLFQAYDFSLLDSERLLIGIASRHNVDVSARVSFYFRALGLFIAFFVLVYTLYERYLSTFLESFQQVRTYLVGAYLILIAAYLDLEVDFVAGAYLCVGFLAYWLKFRKIQISTEIWLLALLNLWSLGLIFLTYFGTAVSVTLFLLILLNFNGSRKILVYFGALSWVQFFTVESWIIGEYEGHDYFPVLTLFLSLIIVLGLTFWLNKKKKTFVFHLIGLLILFSYQIQVTWNGDFFETANQANALMRIFEFGEWPFVDFLSSHGLSDLGAYPLHALIYGFDQSLYFYHYDFFFDALGWTMLALFIYRLTKNGLWTLVIVLLGVQLELFTMGKSALALGIFLFYFQMKRAGWTYYLLGLFLSFGLAWKIEMGLSCGVGVVLLEAYEMWCRKKDYPWKSLAFGLLYYVLTIIAIVAYFGERTFLHFKEALDYFGASQAHGFEEITWDLNRDFYVFYLMMPLAVFGIAFYQWKRLKGLQNQEEKWIPVAILFLSVYFFVNYQRGLVRHSLIEGEESFIISFAYLIFLLQIYQIMKARKGAPYFILASFVLLLFTGRMIRRTPPILSSAWQNIRTWHELIPNFNKENAVDKPPMQAYESWLFETYTQTHLPEGETYLDFSNHPLLYYFTNRKVPSYFNQYLQNGLTFEHQMANIATIDTNEVTKVLMRRNPVGWFDVSDGTQNTWRYFPTSQFIYTHYAPDTVVGPFEIWSLKSKVNKPLYIWDEQQKYFEMGAEAYLIGQDERFQWENASGPENQFLKLDIAADKDQNLTLEVYALDTLAAQFQFKTHPAKEECAYYFPLSAQYNVYLYGYDSVAVKGDAKVVQQEALTLNYEYETKSSY